MWKYFLYVFYFAYIVIILNCLTAKTSELFGAEEKKEMGLLSTLLQWNQLDPPSKAEKLRNDRICKFYQHNRNPFIDHPEYANLIWKRSSATMHSLSPKSLDKVFYTR